jgi:predicted metal-dependent hydrolase
VLTEWYRSQLKEQIPALIDKWQKIIGVEVKDWGIKRMKTKWGTCTFAQRRIWLNLELVKKPQHCLEYIIVHEMVHLLERKHNDRFAVYMDKYLPKWHFYKDELNRSMLRHEIWDY